MQSDSIGPPYEFHCILDYLTTVDGTHRVSSLDEPEEHIDALLTELDGRTPEHYIMSTGGNCLVMLLPDGGVRMHPGNPQGACTISA